MFLSTIKHFFLLFFLTNLIVFISVNLIDFELLYFQNIDESVL